MSASRIRAMERAMLGGGVGMLLAAAVVLVTGFVYVDGAANVAELFVRSTRGAWVALAAGLVLVPVGVALALRRSGERWVRASVTTFFSLLVAVAALFTSVPEPILLPVLLVFGVGAPLVGAAFAPRPAGPALVAA